MQGVGMRPFVARLAKQYRQGGWVANTPEGLNIVVEGDPTLQQQFLKALQINLPPLARIDTLHCRQHPATGLRHFQIKESEQGENNSPWVLPDIAACPQCIDDVFNPESRFYRYPFTSCCDCGPRYSIMTALPYDRERTSMAEFKLCPQCERDFHDPENRRYHAQTIACPRCGPELSLFNINGQCLQQGETSLQQTIQFLREGKIIAVKSIGGFQLWVDAHNQQAVQLLRARKNRLHKPFALMTADIESAGKFCRINPIEQTALTSLGAAIVLLTRSDSSLIAEAVAPDSKLLGVMLAYTPLHHLLLQEFGSPVVATSANMHNEPICISRQQVEQQLSAVADFILDHNRDILRPLDDSLLRVIADKPTILRRARGFAPLPVKLKTAIPDTLAVGAHLHNTIAFSHGHHAILSAHIGDLENYQTRRLFNETASDMQRFFKRKPQRFITDLHADYASSLSLAKQTSPQAPLKVQHHYAHILSCMAEHGLLPPLLGIAWDGAGLGDDGCLWGGEFLQINDKGYSRFAHLKPFPLPGGEKAIQEPRRAALGLLYASQAVDSDAWRNLPFSAFERQTLLAALKQGVNTPTSTSMGRLFDAVAALLDLSQINHYQGQAAMTLEQCAMQHDNIDAYPFRISDEQPFILDWRPILQGISEDLLHFPREYIAKKFHNTLVDMILNCALRAEQPMIVLSGGCFQNAYLTETALQKLNAAGFQVYRHQQIPPNDGGLALGQLAASQYLKE